MNKFVPLGPMVLVPVALILFGVAGCKKDVQETPAPTIEIYGDTIGLPPNAVADVDGNVYQTVVIGSHRWMTTDLRTAHYRNGDVIPYVADNAAWSAQLAGTWSNYDNDAAYDQVTGKLYNWYTVIDPRNVCPLGWHVPTDDEWKDLELALGMPVSDLDNTGPRGASLHVGGMLKSHVLWESPNEGATNEVGFSALPGGTRSNGGLFNGYGSRGYWWSASTNDTTTAWARELAANTAGIYRLNNLKGTGNSIRCVKD
jgi:uncharacterized protein (TIGR02145 family)